MSAVKHIVLVKFKAGTASSQIQHIFAELKRLSKVIPGILDYSEGVDSSPEGLNQGFTHGFIMTFRDTAARDAYLPHPEHERVKAITLPHVESVVVFDFEA
ncbi:MAG: Dabb family protein [Limisphaerales bacterium]